MAIPKAFISYSHDSQEHKKWVLDLATRMRNSGIDAIIDQWELKPGDDLPKFMEIQLDGADYVLMVCTSRYVEKANAGVGGVGYEKMIVTSDLMTNIDSNKIIPIIRQEEKRDVPIFLKTKLFIDFSKKDDYEFSFDDLIRAVHNSPLYEKPEIGNSPFTPIEDNSPEKTGDALKELMAIVVKDYENGNDFTDQDDLREQLGISRILQEFLVKEALDNGLVSLDHSGDYVLQEKGKHYAIEHGIVSP